MDSSGTRVAPVSQERSSETIKLSEPAYDPRKPPGSSARLLITRSASAPAADVVPFQRPGTPFAQCRVPARFASADRRDRRLMVSDEAQQRHRCSTQIYSVQSPPP